MDLDELIPVIGVALLVVTTFAALAGMLALGRARGFKEGSRQRGEDLDTHSRMDRLERQVELMSSEIDRLAEVQRFSLKVIGDRLDAAEAPRLSQGNVITPH